MAEGKINKFFKVSFFVLAIALAIFSSYHLLGSPSSAESEKLELTFFDVGQGDASLVRTTTGQNILIDGGPNRTILSSLSKSLPWWDRGIDLMVLSHPHDDHVSGLTEVLENFQVKKILSTGVVHTSPSYLSFLSTIKESGTELVLARAEQSIVLDKETKLIIIYPFDVLAGEEVGNLNNASIVAKLEYKNTSVLFTGDIELEVEEEILNSQKDIKADILKVPHHGSNTSSHEEFVKNIEPQFAIASMGANNKFGHPSRRVEKRYEDNGVVFLRTDQAGDIKFLSDGENWTLIK